VSKLSGDCPLVSNWPASDHRGTKEPSLALKLKWRDGVKIAEGIYEAIQWGCQNNNDITVETEKRILREDLDMAGTIDMVLTAQDMQMPIEVKRTDADNSWQLQGISRNQVLQCIGEMILLGDKCEIGFVFTRYLESLKVWSVLWDEGGQCWSLKDKNRSVYDIPVQEYQALFSTYRKYRDAEDITTMPPPYKFLADWRCCKVIKPEFYAATGKYHGSMKPGTGIIEVNCPLFSHCFKDKILAASQQLNMNEYPLQEMYDAQTTEA
jgi:hypothetical protein